MPRNYSGVLICHNKKYVSGSFNSKQLSSNAQEHFVGSVSSFTDITPTLKFKMFMFGVFFMSSKYLYNLPSESDTAGSDVWDTMETSSGLSAKLSPCNLNCGKMQWKHLQSYSTDKTQKKVIPGYISHSQHCPN